MYTRFCKEFQVDIKQQEIIEHLSLGMFKRAKEAIPFLCSFQGQTFKRGFYRIHRISEIQKWNAILSKMFPGLNNRFVCFSYDWLGRHFAIDLGREMANEPMILMLEPGTGEAFEIPATFSSFHEEEIIEYMDSVLAVQFFNDWQEKHDVELPINQCVGYKVPLFLGGDDLLDNLEVIDMEVYWEICSQIMNQVRDLPDGTVIGDINLE